jgi:translocation and assembly module TamA
MLRLLLVLIVVFCLSSCSYIPFLNKDQTKNGSGEQAIEEPMIIVDVIGVDDTVADNIRAHVGISSTRCSTSVNLLKRRNKKTLIEANSALQAYGFYEGQVDIEYSETPECPQAMFTVEPGRQMSVADIEIRIEGAANSDPDFQKLTRDIAIKEGESLNHDNYSKTKAMFESVAAELGYLDGRFTNSRLTVDMEKYEARVLLEYESGERYKLGSINIKQEPEFLNESLIRRFIEVPEDSDYSAARVVDIQNRLIASEYFKSVEARPRLNKTENNSIPVDIKVHANNRHRFQTSVGFATDEGLRSKFAYTDRWLNPKGHRLGVESRLSQSEQGISGNYQIPRKHPSNEWMLITAGVRQYDVDTYDTFEAKIGISETKRRFWGIMENHFITLSRDDFEVGGEAGIATFLIPGVRWRKRILDNDLDPNHGLDMSLELRGGTDTVISDSSFIRSNFNIQYLYKLPFGFKTILRGQAGGMWVDEFRALPPSERFFAGGDRSIRGYDFQDLGPINSSGKVIGGEYIGIISFELEKYLTEKWGVAGFVDTGNAFGGPGSDTGLKTGIGLGLRWRSPVGPVRVDLAHPLDDDTAIKLHLRIGPDF